MQTTINAFHSDKINSRIMQALREKVVFLCSILDSCIIDGGLVNTVLRYICALFWMIILCCFSYSELLLHVISQSEKSFEAFFIETNSNLSMILVNVGMIGMLYVDNFITNLCTKKTSKVSVQEPCFVICVIIAILMTIISQMIVNGELVLAQWLKVSYLFAIFIAALVVYKAKSLEIAHVSDDQSILPSANH